MENGVVTTPPVVVSIELVVDDLDRALELFGGALGLEVLSRGPAAHVTGRTATIDGGGCLITLLEPASSGEGTILADRVPRLSQIVMGAGPLEVPRWRDETIRSGLACVALPGGGYFVSPESARGALGQPVAIVVSPVEA